MKVLKAYKFEMVLTAEQSTTISSWMHITRAIYNLSLEQRILIYRHRHIGITAYDQMNELPALKEEFPWIGSVPSQVLQQKILDLDKAYQSFFRGGGFPKWKKRHESNSLRFPTSLEVIETKGKRKALVKLPKLGFVNFISSRKIEGKIKNATVTLTKTKKFFISFQCEVEIHANNRTKENPVGIDRGIANNMMTSEGEVFLLPNNSLDEIESKIARAQKKLARQRAFAKKENRALRDSKNYQKQKQKIAALHEKAANIKKDYVHKSTTQIANSHGYVVIENLRIKNMSKSASGTLAEPGKNVAQKRGLNKSILRQNWHEIERQLGYKLGWSGGQLVKIHPAYTSQTCNKCKHVCKENRKGENFSCTKCGHKDHADINAAKNILAAGHAVAVCGETSVGPVAKPRDRRVSKKQKPAA